MSSVLYYFTLILWNFLGRRPPIKKLHKIKVVQHPQNFLQAYPKGVPHFMLKMVRLVLRVASKVSSDMMSYTGKPEAKGLPQWRVVIWSAIAEPYPATWVVLS